VLIKSDNGFTFHSQFAIVVVIFYVNKIFSWCILLKNINDVRDIRGGYHVSHAEVSLPHFSKQLQVSNNIMVIHVATNSYNNASGYGRNSSLHLIALTNLYKGTTSFSFYCH